jgi:sulfatase modifying factor 1
MALILITKVMSRSKQLNTLFYLFSALLILSVVSFKRINLNQDQPYNTIEKSLSKENADSTLREKENSTNSLGMTLVPIESSTFNMGSSDGDYDEKPVHEVAISKPFYMSATPVTNEQYEQFDLNHKLLRGQRGLSSKDDEAVVFVSWHDAIAFTKWLGQKEGKPYRLPTEAEWEFACRANTTSSFFTGDTLPAIYQLSQTDKMYPTPVKLTVGTTPPNDWGLFNMHGLVEEWCLDWYGPYSATKQTDPVGYAQEDFKVTRGGSHNTGTKFLRSANRSGMIPSDKNYLVGFRVVQAEIPTTQTLSSTEKKQWEKNVPQTTCKWKTTINMNDPYFDVPIAFQNVPSGSYGPLYSNHNHCPDITSLPNGDLLATWYSTNTEQGRELAVAASRLRKGAINWDAPSVFYKVPDRNMHATSIWWDKTTNRIYHFQGVSVAYHWGDLAMFMRVSEDNGATWSKQHWINPEHGLRNMPIAGVIKTRSGSIVVPCDAMTGGEGGSAVHISNDNGISWYDPGKDSPKPLFEEGETGGWIAGIHAKIVELKDGSLMALGRGNSINEKMPMSISKDMGQTWSYSASPFPPISGGQRLALIRLSEGPLLFASFTGSKNDDKGMKFTDKEGNEFRGFGLFVAISYDEGNTWPVRKLITYGEGEYDGGAWTGKFKMDATHAEPAGYLATTQSPDNIIHLISSRLHYRFNLEWIKQ